MMKLHRVLLIVAAGLLMQACAKEMAMEEGLPSGNEPVLSGGDVVDGWIRIKLSEDSPELKAAVFTRGNTDSGNEGIDRVAEQLGATEIRRVFPDAGKFEAKHRKYGLHLWYDVKIDNSIPVSRAGNEFSKVPGVAFTEPIYKIKIISSKPIPADAMYAPSSYGTSQASETAPFNDPQFSKQWNLYNDGSLAHSVAGADINAIGGWKITAGSPDVVVAVLDSGVQFDHPDLAANMWINTGEIPGDGIDNDGNGKVDDIYGWNFMKEHYSGTITPGMHATHVAGIMAAVNNNGEGVCGVAGGTGNNDGVRIMTLQAYSDTEDGDPAVFPEMFTYAADNGAVIAQCSWVYSQSGMTQSISEAIDYFNAEAGTDENGNQTGPMKGGLCIFGAGNTGTEGVYYPAKDPRVIGVTAMTADYGIATYSNYGEGADLFAPGGTNIYPEREYYILSTVPGGKYGYAAGTSMATPHVAGVAALIVSKFKGDGFTGADLKSKLLQSYRPVGEYVDQKFNGKVGLGLVDASLILTEVPAGNPAKPEGAKAEAVPAGITVICPVPLDGNGMPVAKFTLKYAENVNGKQGEWVQKTLINTYPAGKSFVYKLALKSEMEYAFQMNAIDRYGRETEYVSFKGTTLRYTNNPPVLKKDFPETVSIKNTDLIRYYYMAEYFSEPDAQYGDELTFTTSSSDERIATSEVTNNNKVTIYPKAKGACNVTIVATDSNGASKEVVLKVEILEGPSTNTPPAMKKDFPATVTIEDMDKVGSFDLSEYFYDADEQHGDALTYSADSSDENIAVATVSGNNITITPKAKGSSNVTIVATDKSGAVKEVVTKVEVLKGPATNNGNATSKLSVYPNPVDSEANISIKDAGSMALTVNIYDGASRRVLTQNVTLNGGTARLNVAKLAPGSYTIVAKGGGNSYNAVMIKR